MPHVKVNDIQMYYEVHGEGEPLVLILGLGADISEWDGIIRWFSEKYRYHLDCCVATSCEGRLL